MTPTEVRRLLQRHGLAPRKADGQNFLVDPNTIHRIVDAAAVTADDHVVEVGPGLGAITGLLADEAAHVTAIEVDTGLVQVVRERLGARDNLDIVHADAMTIDVDGLVSTADHRLRMVSNLPYNVATPLLLHAFAGVHLVDAWVMVQREVADRWIATVGDSAYGAVSVKLGLVVDLSIELAIPRSVFHPVPHVDSVMVHAVRHGHALDPMQRQHVHRVVDVAFRQPRKTLRNNLRRTWPDHGVAALNAADVDPGRRAETLAVDEFVALTRALGDRVPVDHDTWSSDRR